MNERQRCKWEEFKNTLPHKNGEYSKRNWGDELHSLCSYQGKLKPSIAHHLVKIFSNENDIVFDPFSGVGTIPLESLLMNRRSLSMDLSEVAQALTVAKISMPSYASIDSLCIDLEKYIKNYVLTADDDTVAHDFGFNGKLVEYFHPDTLREIFAARDFISQIDHASPSRNMLASAILHILHGNRPYALSRRSHSITPYAPSGEYEYKNLIGKVRQKIDKTYAKTQHNGIRQGKFILQDSMEDWPSDCKDLDAIITSPPFFDSTKFYMANWMRMWMMGWNKESFKTQPPYYLDERQKKSMDVYRPLLARARSSLKPGGILVMHIGKSSKMDMGQRIADMSGEYFTDCDLFNEDVSGNESHGITDKGSVKSHQYLILS